MGRGRPTRLPRVWAWGQGPCGPVGDVPSPPREDLVLPSPRWCPQQHSQGPNRQAVWPAVWVLVPLACLQAQFGTQERLACVWACSLLEAGWRGFSLPARRASGKLSL